MPYGDAESWTAIDHQWRPVGPAEEFLSFLHSTEHSPNTVKAYAHDLRDYFEFLAQAGLGWDEARLEDAGRTPDRQAQSVEMRSGQQVPSASDVPRL